MKKRKILAVLMTIVMSFSAIPSYVSAAEKAPAGEEYIEVLEMIYMETIRDRSKYCDDVWNEIQQVYQEGRAYGLEEDLYGLEECMVILEQLGGLTWVKSYDDLEEVKSRYLKEINDQAKSYKKSDYNDYNWDFIQDGLYIGSKRIHAATTFSVAAMGYYEAMIAMAWATTEEELKMYKDEYLNQLSRVINFYIDARDYSAPLWEEIQKVYEEAVVAIVNAEQESELEALYEKYLEKICVLAKLTYPLDYEIEEQIMEEIMKPAYEFYEEMTSVEYTTERLWEAEELIWELEDALYEAADRIIADEMVAKTLKKLKALPTREEEEKFYKEYVLKAKAVGISGTSIKVTWNADKKFDGYIVYRATSEKGAFKEVKRYGSGKTSSFTDKNVTYGKNYYYKVKGIKSMDFVEKYTKLSKAVKGTPKLVKPVVTLKKAGSQDVKLTWKRVDGADGYQIYRSNSVNGQFKLVKTIKKGDTLTWKDTSTVKGKKYCYKMRAYDVKKDKSKKYSAYSTIKTIRR